MLNEIRQHSIKPHVTCSQMSSAGLFLSLYALIVERTIRQVKYRKPSTSSNFNSCRRSPACRLNS